MEALSEEITFLPEPSKKGQMSFEETIFLRRSVREFSDYPLSLKDLSQLLWVSQGKVKSGRRAAPSAGALYPLEIYAVCGNVKGLTPGVYRYDSKKHSLQKITEGDRRIVLSSAALGQYWVKDAPLSIVISAIFERTTKKYGERGIRYVFIEVGHVAQNILLQAVALNLGAVPVGAFYDDEVKKALNIPSDEQPLYIIPIGKEK
ncbi:MAG: SagB/ThcOx family dehydrogenase [Deltaproteobacteria bacterium]|nr:SagB/ThcOx family dehydrogenase [Deltaproteobacteria bacterium]